MRVRVLFFGQLKEIVGLSQEEAELSEGARVEDLFERYGRRFPRLAEFRPSVAASLNQEYTEWRTPLAAGGGGGVFLPGGGAAGGRRWGSFFFCWLGSQSGRANWSKASKDLKMERSWSSTGLSVTISKAGRRFTWIMRPTSRWPTRKCAPLAAKSGR